MPVKLNNKNCICVRDIDLTSVSTIVLLGFEAVLIVLFGCSFVLPHFSSINTFHISIDKTDGEIIYRYRYIWVNVFYYLKTILLEMV